MCCLKLNAPGLWVSLGAWDITVDLPRCHETWFQRRARVPEVEETPYGGDCLRLPAVLWRGRPLPPSLADANKTPARRTNRTWTNKTHPKPRRDTLSQQGVDVPWAM